MDGDGPEPDWRQPLVGEADPADVLVAFEHGVVTNADRTELQHTRALWLAAVVLGRHVLPGLQSRSLICLKFYELLARPPLGLSLALTLAGMLPDFRQNAITRP